MNGKVEDPAIAAGRYYAHPPPGDEICITGISGSFPNSLNVEELKKNLFNKTDMVSEDERRWNHFHPEVPRRLGKICNVQKFDPGFFGMHHRQAESMEPMQRLILEKAVECIFDAGIHPSEMEGTRTGIYSAVCFTESKRNIFYENIEIGNNAILSGLQSIISNRVSHFLKVKGPSCVVDSGCSSYLYAFETAYKDMRNGICDMALVAACNLCLDPATSLQFARLGVTNAEGMCKTFDESGNGYCRSEAASCVLLQKKKISRRIYSKVIHVKTNCDGFKDLGILFPSREIQTRLLKEFYEECEIDPMKIGFIETHGTGTKAGDPVETAAIDEVFCVNRDKPLLIGAIKSNMGHTEGAAGLSGAIKMIIAMEEGHIPPNIHFNTPNKEIKGLIEGRMKVVVENTPLPDNTGLMAINSLGFGGANSHMLLEWNHKTKVHRGRPNDDIPRLVCVSGRNREAISSLLDHITGNFDAEYIQLLYEIFKKNIECHNHRGYNIVSKSGKISASSKRYSEVRPKLLMTFSNFGNSWHNFARQLLVLPVFAETIHRVDRTLVHTGLNISNILQNSSFLPSNSVVDNILGTLILQIGIIEILKNLQVEPNFIFGLGTSEIACAYFDGFLTLEQAVLTGLEIADYLKDISEASVTYVVKFATEKDLENLPKNVGIIWKFSDDAVAISGEVEVIHNFVTDLAKTGVEVIDLGFNDVIFPSKNISEIEPALRQKLLKIIPARKARSSLWLSTSGEPLCSAEYFLKSLYSKNGMPEVIDFFASDTIIFEIGSGKLFELLHQGHRKPLDVILLNKEKSANNGVVALLEILGRLYESGYNPQIQNLYPKIQYPVSRGTPTISDKIKWEHSKDWHVVRYSRIETSEGGDNTFSVFPTEDTWQYLKGHVIDGRNLFPASGYIDMIWKTFAASKKAIETETAVVIERCKLYRTTTLSKNLNFIIQIQEKSGNFELFEDGVDIMSGKIRLCAHNEIEQLSLRLPPDDGWKNVLKMNNNDIYKEMHIKGYHHNDEFQLIQESNMNTTRACIKWTGNWVTFMDNLLQFEILQHDTRMLYVPTGLKRIIINPEKHLQYVNSFGANPMLPVYNYKDAGIIRCGGIQIEGISTTSIARRKELEQPLLQRYEFTPNETTTFLLESLRINMQIATENVQYSKFNITEVYDDATKEGMEPLAPLILEIFSDLPSKHAVITILTTKEIEIGNVTVEKNEKLASVTDCLLIIGTDILQRPTVMNQAFGALKENGFILSREELDVDPFAAGQEKKFGIEIITIHTTEKEKFIFFRKSAPLKYAIVVEISEKDEYFNWLTDIQKAMETSSTIIMYAQNEESNGLLGFYNCMQKEAGGTKLQCFLISGEDTPPFDVSHPFYREQLNKNLSVNIYKDGKWGTYRHLLLMEEEEVESEHCFITQTVKKDLSSFKLVTGPLNSKNELPTGKTLVHVYYTPINFMDIMNATGRVSMDNITMSRLEPDSEQGIEFVGRDTSGRRVMGVASPSMSTLLLADNQLVFEIPDSWSMEEAATVPAVYLTVIYALIMRGKMRRGESILIHCGTGGIGQAAIHVAFAIGCNIFTTVGTTEKKKLLMKLFPQLTDRQIGNSRDSTFEMMVKKETKGRGVDAVLNSLAEEKLIASIRCLAKGGRFLEIGKFDASNDNRLALMLLDEERSFHGVMLDKLFSAPLFRQKVITSLFKQVLASGIIKPLTKKVFQLDEIEEAYRFMTTGKHTGKVIIRLRKEELQKNKHVPSVIRFKGLGRFCCDPEKSYVLIGGLGGLGMELANWFVLRGAKKLILTSRTGVRTGYQAYNTNIWKSYGVIVLISTADITNKEGCEKLVTESQELGPVDGLFNLAVVLKDSILENQTPETFKTSFGPKAIATKYLDEITRRRCPQLRYFVVFSSFVCGRGNTGQTNYGMANSVMEKICEQRRKVGYPALAIQWGTVADVGLVVEKEMTLNQTQAAGINTQKVSSYLQVMDTFLSQKKATIVSSIVVMDKKKKISTHNITDTTAAILGIKKETVSPHTSLAELGMDSLTAVEMKQTLEREFEIFASPQEIRTLTFARLQEIQDARHALKEKIVIPTKERLKGFDALLQNFPDYFKAMIPVVRLPSLVGDTSEAPFLFAFPGMDGYVETLRPLAAKLKAKVVGLQCCSKVPPTNLATNVKEMLEQINTYLKPNDIVNIVSFSWGTILALEVIFHLEKRGYEVNLVILDGAPDFVQEMLLKELKATTEKEIQISVLCLLMLKFLSPETLNRNREILEKCSSSNERYQVFLEAMKNVDQLPTEYKKAIAIVLCDRLIECSTYKATYGTIKATTKLFKPYSPLYQSRLPEDYNLSKICLNLQEIKYFQGNHRGMLDNTLLADAINDAIMSI